MTNRIKTKIHNKFLLVLIAIVLLNISSFSVSANAIFNLMGLVKYTDGTSLMNGDAASPNSFASARAYRSNVDTNYSISNKPSNNHIYAAANSDPAYFLFDVGSSSWNPYPQVGDTAIVVLETFSGQNAWGGNSFVAGVKKNVTESDLNNNGIDFDLQNAVMEQIPTPVLISNTYPNIQIGWTGLWDTNTGNSSGSSNNSIIGYSVYRSDNQGPYELIGEVAQQSGQSLSFTDVAVSLGHIYNYKLKVRFEWNAHIPNYYESFAESNASADINLAVPTADRIAFTTSEQTITAGIVSSVITLQSRDLDGNATPVNEDTTIALSSNSTSLNKKFYEAVDGECSANIVNSVVIYNSTSTTQFCYYDEVATNTGWQISAHKSNPVSPEWLDATQNIFVDPGVLNSFQFNITSPQNNKVAFSGVNTITAVDGFGNVKTNFNASQDLVSITVTPNDGSISGLSGVQTNQLGDLADFIDGVANLTNRLTYSGVSGYHTFTATSASGRSSTSSPIFINAAQATHLEVIAPAQVTSGEQFSITQIKALDEFNNVDNNFNGIKVVEYSGPQDGALGNIPVYTTTVNFENGLSTTDLATILIKAETTQITAEIGGISGISNSITVISGEAANFIIPAPSNATAGVNFSIGPITAFDQYGNISTTYQGTKTLIYLGPENGPVSGIPSFTTKVEFENGQSVTPLITNLVKKENTIITVSDGQISGSTNNINVLAGDVGAIAYVSGNNQTGRINTFLPEPLVVEVTDIFGNLKNNYPVTFAITQGNGYLPNENAVTGSDGRASVTYRLGSVASENSDEVQAIINGAQGSPVSFSFTATPNDASNLIVTSATNVVAGDEFIIDLSVVDEENNLITTYNGTKTLSYSGANNSPNGQAPSFLMDVEFNQGRALNIPVTLVNAESISLSIEIPADNLNGTSSPITVIAAQTSKFNIIAPNTVQSGVSFNLISINTTDTFGNSTIDYSGLKTLEYSGPGLDPISGNEPIYTNEVNFIAGEATTELNTTLFKAETVSITITQDQIIGTSNSILVTYNEDFLMYYVSGNNQTGVAGQALDNPLVLLILDREGNPVTDKNIDFEIIGGGTIENNVVDEITGEITITWVLGTGTGLQAVTISSDGINTTLEFTATAVADSASTITVLPQVVSAYATYSTQAINICLQDQYGNQVVTNLNRSINLSSSSTTGEFSTNLSGPWNLNSVNIVVGQSCAEFYYKDITAGNYIFTASGNGLTSATSTINILALIPTTIQINPSSFTIKENNTQQLSAIVYDQFGESIVNANISWEMSDTAAGTITQSGLYYPSRTAGTYSNAIKVSSGNLNAYSTPTITVNPVTPPVTPVQPPVQPTQPVITQVTPPTTPVAPTTPVVVEVDQDYFSDDEGKVPVIVEVPAVSILSPRQGSLILSNGHISISGTSIPNQIVVVKDAQNNILGSVTSDNNGYWKIFVSRNKFSTDHGTVTASLFNTDVATAPLTFDFKPRSFAEYIYDLIFSN